MSNPPVRIGQSDFNTYWQCETTTDRDEYMAESPGVPKIPVINGDCILVAEESKLYTRQNGKWYGLN